MFCQTVIVSFISVYLSEMNLPTILGRELITNTSFAWAPAGFVFQGGQITESGGRRPGLSATGGLRASPQKLTSCFKNNARILHPLRL